MSSGASSVEGVLELLNQLVIKSPKVKVVNTIRGRSLVATTHIHKDEQIFTSVPMVSWPAKKQAVPLRLDRVCNHCFAPNKDAVSCSSCKFDPIFMNNMKKYHKLIQVDNNVASKYEPMVNKLAYRLGKEMQDGYENTNYILNLLSAPFIAEDIKGGLKEQYEELKTNLVEVEPGLKKEMDKFLSLDWYCRSLGVLHLNSVGTPLGSALYDDISFINHSCSPTVGLLFQGMRATVVSLKNMDPSEELFINYAEMVAETNSWNHDEVQSHLKENYGFDCSATCSCGKLRNL